MRFLLKRENSETERKKKRKFRDSEKKKMKIQIAVLFAYYMGCEATLCTEDFHVSNNACVECAPGQSNLAGDDPSGQDTSCDTCKITTNEELRDHIDLWIEMSDTATHPCGPIVGDWEVGRVTDMSICFVL